MHEKYASDTALRPESFPSAVHDDAIDLYGLVLGIWRNRFFLSAMVLGVISLAIAYVLLVTPQYEVRAIVAPGIVGFNEEGVAVRGGSSENLKNWFKNEGFLSQAVSKYGEEAYINGTIPAGKNIFFEIEKGGTDLVVSFLAQDPELGKEIMRDLLQTLAGQQESFRFTVEEQEKKIIGIENAILDVDVELFSIKEKIQQKKNAKMVLRAEFEMLAKSESQKKEIIERVAAQIGVVHENTQRLMVLRENIAKGTGDKFSSLMYSNIVQQNISYSATLEQRWDNLKKELNDIDVLREKISAEQKVIDSDISQLELQLEKQLPVKRDALVQRLKVEKARLARMNPLEIVSAPSSSVKPVKPKKTLTVAAVGTGGLFVGILAVFLREAVRRARAAHSA